MAEFLLGIRHHGPGSARSALRALEQIEPDIVLVEGPADAESLIELSRSEELVPPVAMLLYEQSNASNALFFPFASFSPEWVALQFAHSRGIAVRFIDLPAAHTLAVREEAPHDLFDTTPGNTPDRLEALRRDPVLELARAAGYEDSERFWEHMVEQRQDGSELFEAVAEAMCALRSDIDLRQDRRELAREAHMRKALRRARNDGFGRIAVVCGAWHVPALLSMPPVSEDRSLLANLPKRTVAATWIPWSHSRLTLESGYGAGVESPGWYHHLFTCADSPATRWLSRIARCLRESGFDASPAQVIDSVRLAESLAALRDRPSPGLTELHEAAESVLLAGESLPWTLIHKQLIIGEDVGRVPDDTPMVPLQRDLVRLQKKLRLDPEGGDREVVLDLRKDIDRQRSLLLRRLRLLDIPWGEGGERGAGLGTFKEEWELCWDPEFSLRIIEASPQGPTLEAASAAVGLRRANDADSLPVLTRLVREIVLADLPSALPGVLSRLQSQAATTTELTRLMLALPALAHLVRYGDVRGTAAAPVLDVTRGIVARCCVGLPAACLSLREDSANPMLEAIGAMQAALAILDDANHLHAFHDALLRVADDSATAPSIQGRACRILIDAARVTSEEAARRLAFHSSRAESPSRTAAWLDGFLRGSGQVLAYDDVLWQLIDDWLTALDESDFIELLPLLRRTFSTFTEPEKRSLGERARAQFTRTSASEDREAGVDPVLADASLALVRRFLGLESTS